MAEAEGLPPAASVASVGLSIRYVGNHIYATSGLVASGTTTETTLLEFTTANESYIVGYIHFVYSNDTSQDMTYRLYFNDQIVWQYVAQTAAEDVQGRNDVYILIPGGTIVKGTHESDGASRDSCVFLTGRVYVDKGV